VIVGSRRSEYSLLSPAGWSGVAQHVGRSTYAIFGREDLARSLTFCATSGGEGLRFRRSSIALG
jgi:hypothetical protein